MENTISSIGLQQYWHILRRRWLSATTVFILVMAGSVALTHRTQPIYEAEGKLRFKNNSLAESLTELGSRRGNEPLVREGNPLDTEIEIIRSVPTLQTTIDRLGLQDEQGQRLSRSQLLENLSLVNRAGTDLLTIAYRDTDPEQAMAIVNTLIETYLTSNLQVSRADAAAARSFISNQLPAAESRVHQLELELRRFKEQHQVVSIEEESRSAVTNLADLQRRIAETQSDLASVQAQSNEFRNQLGMDVKQASTLTALSQSAGVQEVLGDLQEVESQLAAERVRFRDSHPIITALLEKKANLESLLNQRVTQTVGGQQPVRIGALQGGTFRADLAEEFVRVQVQRAGLANKVNSLSNVKQTYQQRINILPQIEQKLRELERKLDAAQATYSLLLQRFQEAQVAENQNVGNAHIVQPAALLEQPVAPNLPLNLAVAGIIGTLLAVATALLREAQDRSLRTIQEAKELFGDVLLGIIPLHHRDRSIDQASGRTLISPDVMMYHAPGSPSSESYRLLQTNLRSLSADQGLKTIIVTSSIPKEGKSTISANLALALAQTNRRVLLIDADMRCPCQHQLWGCSNDLGLSQVLMGQSSLEMAVQAVDQIDLLTAGKPIHPSALLDSEQMTELLHECSDRYDFVLIDTPAWNVAADVAILGQKADGILFVVRPGVTDLVSAKFARESLKQANQNVLGLVINGTTLEPEHYSANKKYYPETIASPALAGSQTNGMHH